MHSNLARYTAMAVIPAIAVASGTVMRTPEEDAAGRPLPVAGPSVIVIH